MTDVPPARQCTLPSCEREASDPTSPTPVCEDHLKAVSDGGGDRHGDDGHCEQMFAEWGEVDFSATTPDTYPPFDRAQWMGRKEKLPFSPWADRDHPDAEADEDARYKWGIEDNYADDSTVAMAEDDPRLDGRVFIQREDDPYAHVDGDDVRDPETGEVHPAFVAILEHLGLTYADVSTSGTGVHADYKGETPIDGKGQATFEIDTEPWGSNDDVPTVEIYANTRVNVTTGDHVEGTPIEVREWDSDALRSILQANGYEDKPDVSHDTDRERPDLEGYDPQTTTPDETADDVRDVLHAIDRLRPRDVPLSSSQTGSDSTGWETWDPSYRSSSSGESVHRPPSESVFYDHKEGESFGLLGLFAAEQGIISKPWDRLAGADWWGAVETAREHGAPIPAYDSQTEDVESVAVLPDSPDLETASSGWDWKQAAGRDEQQADPLQEPRDRATEKIASAIGTGDRVLIEALPTLGKSYGAVAAAADTGQPVTILTTRGNKEQYGQLEEWCEQHGLTYKRLPAFTRHCETARGDHGQEWKRTVMDWYNRGATPKQIHALAEHNHGSELPCQADGQCELAAAWDFDPEEHPATGEPWDVLIGHYTHAYKPNVVAGRTVMFDEFPEQAFETTLSHGIEGAITYLLQQHDAIPFEDYTDLVENRSDESRRADALAFLADYVQEDDAQAVLLNKSAHAAAPAAALTILGGAKNDLGNGWERANFPDDQRVGLFDRETGSVSIHTPPDLNYASSVIALDGTPTKDLWRFSLGERLNHTQVLTDAERREYVTEKLNLNLVRTTDAVKSYSPKASEIENRVSLKEDSALLEAIGEQHGERPSLITTNRAEQLFEDKGVLELASDVAHYGNVLGSNKFDDTRLGAVFGSRNFGPRYVEKWAAYLGETVEPTFPSPENDFTPTDYGEVGNRIRTHMREHETLQAAMRFGRDGNGAVVYVHTNTLPDWVPLAGEGRVLSTRSDGERQVIAAATDLEEWTAEAIAAHPDVDVGTRQVQNILKDLAETGAVEWDVEGCGYVWRDTGLHELNDHGEVDLEPVELDDLQSDETSPSILYTWSFVRSRSSGGDTGSDAGVAAGSLGTRGVATTEPEGPPPG